MFRKRRNSSARWWAVISLMTCPEATSRMSGSSWNFDGDLLG
jgi:hypothetical protein